MRKFLREIWSASDFEANAVARHARAEMRHEAKQGVYAMAVLTLVMMLALSCLYFYLGVGTEHLYTFAMLGVLAVHVALSAKKLPDTAELTVLYLLGMVLLALSALAVVLLAQRDGYLTAPTLSTVVLLFMVVPLVPWGLREALMALAIIYVIFTGSTLSASRFTSSELLSLQFLMIGATLIALAVVARMVIVRKGHLEARFDLSCANEQLITMAMQDPLTGSKNRRFLEERYPAIVSRYAASADGFLFCVLDIDRFKMLNDTYGHACGDRVLQRLTKCITNALPADDHVVRMGGDEFVILTRSADLPARFARALASFNSAEAGAIQPTPHANVSLGVARVRPHTSPDFDALYLAADNALYAAKARGAGAIVEVQFDETPAEALAS